MMLPTATATAVFLTAAPSSFSTRRRRSRAIFASLSPSFSSSEEPLLVRAARGEDGLPRPPAWMMRQAGRYMAEYQALAKRHPSFRERSENTDLIVEITLQPWRAFAPDGVILFSDILTPLPAIGVPFDISDSKGPVIQSPVRSKEQVRELVPIDLDMLQFVGESLKILRNEIDGKAALLGFVGAPWTIATYIVEGGMTNTYTNIKSMCHTAPDVLKGLLSHLAQAISDYIIYQVNSGPSVYRYLIHGVDSFHLMCGSSGQNHISNRVVKAAGPKGHILNLGHGVLQKTPEEAVAHFFDVTRRLRYDTLFQGSVAEELHHVA
ncbi:Uroporphyrinogen decarboxylase [Zea mays]|uniref:Uroporphyrinogen decarboxylase n=3 Tax=Zea mays TaxID=4577 RepID=A0A1D6FZP6_MAIZE|nr:Uroporphyrinogen decarboxylase [Zea mays]